MTHKFSAEHAPILPLTKTRWLTYRDVPQLIKQYVNGTIALDYGCGNSISSIFLRSCGLEVEGVDINAEIIASAKQLDPEGKYAVIESGKIPQVDNHYDLVFAGWVFAYVSNKGELLRILQEIYRSLKIDGTFIALVSNENTYYGELLTSIIQYDQNKNPCSGCQIKVETVEDTVVVFNYFWTAEDYHELMAKAGFNIVKVHHPLGKESDGYEWKSEKEKPVCDIYVARKTSNICINKQ